MNTQLRLRMRYAQDKRNKAFLGSSKRVAWKSRSRFIA